MDPNFPLQTLNYDSQIDIKGTLNEGFPETLMLRLWMDIDNEHKINIKIKIKAIKNCFKNDLICFSLMCKQIDFEESA